MNTKELSDIIMKFSPYDVYNAFRETYFILVQNDPEFRKRFPNDWFNIRITEEANFSDWSLNQLDEVTTKSRVITIEIDLLRSCIRLNNGGKQRDILTSDLLSTIVISQRNTKLGKFK